MPENEMAAVPATKKGKKESVGSNDPVKALPWIELNEILHWETSVARTSRSYQLWMCENSHLHAFSEIVVCLEGTHFYGVNGQALAMGPGSIVLIPQNMAHDSWYSVHHDACTDLWLHFLPHGYVTLNTVRHEPAKGPAISSLACPDPGLLSDFNRAFSLIHQSPVENGTVSRRASAFLLYMLHSLFEKLVEGKRVRKTSDETPIIKSIKEYATNHLTDRLTLEELARVAGFSPFHFHRIFARSEGVTPRHFIETKRIQHACRLLKEGRSITSAGLDSGFATCSQFDRVFKLHLHLTPSDWLKQNNKL